MREIPLVNSDEVALVDDEDLERLCGFRWFRHSQGYACRRVWTPDGTRNVYMHREIIGARTGYEVDHKNQVKLDNRRENLRECTRRFNNVNKNNAVVGRKSSRFRGVSWKTGQRIYVAVISICNRAVHLGVFRNEEVAAMAYDEAARKEFGEFAVLNFPREGERGALVEHEIAS